MELMTGRLHKGLDLPPPSRDVTVASVRGDSGGSTGRLTAKLSLYFIQSVSDISYGMGHSIVFFPAFDCASLTRSPP
jgi:hypothetical protein